MKRISSTALVIIAIVCFLLTMIFSYLWCTLPAPASTVFSVLVFLTAIIFLVSINSLDKK